MSGPGELGYRMPAEWEAHAATWLAWPHCRDDWPGKFAAIPWVYAEIVRQLHVAEPVRILVNNARGEQRTRQVLSELSLDWNRIAFIRCPTDRAWVRDSGPLFVKSGEGEVAATKWRFNAWAKYANWKHDDAVPGKILQHFPMRCWDATFQGQPVVLEGGSIDVNGAGLLLTTEECLLSPVQARNPGLARSDLEGVFRQYLGVDRVLWLNRGIAGDDTHGHIDDLARFVAATTVVAVVEDDPSDENYEPLQENLERLRGMPELTDVIPLPMPAPVWFQGQRLPASYANFYIANDRVLVPTFNDPKDRLALGILAELFSGREVVGIHAIDLVWGLGTLHCLTLQQPASAPVSGPGIATPSNSPA